MTCSARSAWSPRASPWLSRPGLLAPSLPGNVRLLRLVDPPTRAVYAVRRADRDYPVVDALVEALTAVAGPD